jgi:hypothetical protein
MLKVKNTGNQNINLIENTKNQNTNFRHNLFILGLK